MTSARVVRAATAWVVLIAVLRLFVLAPEQCTPPQPAAIDLAVSRTAAWFEHNQLSDGRFVYAYARGEEPETLIHLVRHHGVLVSLYQAADQNVDGALETAEQALAWSLDHLIDTGDGTRAVGFRGDTVRTGSTALLVAALVERGRVVDGSEDDALLVELGRFLMANVTEEGEVSASWSLETGPVGDRSLFFTGEVMWALSLLAESAPDGPIAASQWLDAARRIGHHIALDRDRVEGRIAVTPDHWSAYGLDQIGVAGTATDIEIGHARRTAGLISVRIRLESQNPDSGPIRWTRGAHSLAAGVGTLGEGLAGIIRLAERDDRLADIREPMRDNLACVTGLLISRQLTEADVRSGEDPDLVVGAWFRNGRTQQDDQQHALSALLAADLILDGSEDRARRVDHDQLAGWLIFAMTVLVAADPVRARVARRRDGADQHAGPRWLPVQAVRFAAIGAIVVSLGPAVLDWAELNEPTVRLAAGLIIMITGASDLISPSRTGTSVIRPGAMAALLAGSVDPGPAGALFAVAVTASVVAFGELMPLSATVDDETARTGWSPRLRHVSWVVAAAALVLGTGFAIDGVFEF